MKFCCIAKTSALIAGLIAVVLSLSVQQTNAESFVDKLNKKLEQSNIKVQKNAPNQPASGQDQMPANRQSKSGTPGSGQAMASSAMRDVDIVGLKIGMSVAEARAALKARKLPGYEETMGQLTYFLGNPQPFPGGEFLSDAVIYPKLNSMPDSNPLPVTELLWVSFTPEPGKERVAYISRTVRFSEKNVLSEEEFIKSLIKKYGAPAVHGKLSYNILVWGVPARGDGVTWANCNDYMRDPIDGLSGTVGGRKLGALPNWVLGIAANQSSARGSESAAEHQARECGHTYLYIALDFVNPLATPGQRFLRGYRASLKSPVLAVSSYQTAAKLTEVAKAAEEQRLLKRAKGQKAPDL